MAKKRVVVQLLFELKAMKSGVGYSGRKALERWTDYDMLAKSFIIRMDRDERSPFDLPESHL